VKSIEIGTRLVGPGAPALIIAELAWAHDGDLDKAARIARGAAKAGADAFSIHVTSLPDYMVRHYGNPGTVSDGKLTSDIYAYLEKINLGPEQVTTLAGTVRDAGLAVCLMPNDHPSLRLCERLDPDAYVLAPACFVEEDFVAALGEKRRPVILRIGGATLGEIEGAVNLLRENGADQLLLLHGFQTYPTRLEETNLRVLPVLSRLFDCPVGLADHLDGADDLALVIPPLALALGASALEKHITWDREERGEDFESALDPVRFATFVRYVRSAETALGGETMPSLSVDALNYRQVSRKRVVAAEDIPAGTVLEARHLACKRSDEGAQADQRTFLIGRRTRAALLKDAPVMPEQLH
jgi:sialic acid synthase SpsE